MRTGLYGSSQLTHFTFSGLKSMLFVCVVVNSFASLQSCASAQNTIAVVSAEAAIQPNYEVGFAPDKGIVWKILPKLEESSLFYIFKKGGPIMWPLLFASILAMGTVIDRIVFLVGKRRWRDPKALEAFLSAISKGDKDKALQISNHSKYHILRVLGYALEHREQSLENALSYAKEREMKTFRRGIPVLDTVITLAPLLGLLGTVTGMMGSFSLIGGELSAPGSITGGIAEALIATAFGLGIAITSLIPFNYLNTQMENVNLEIESAVTQLELLFDSQRADTVIGEDNYPNESVDEEELAWVV